MLQRYLVSLLLSPFALLYGMAVSLRDGLYRQGLLKGVEFNLPVISVGNLSVGGAGKTPHIEYLIRLLLPYVEVATLSRGYRRKTRGYLAVASGMNAEQAGDEPLQFKRKFPDVYVAVSESRTFGIPQIVQDRPDTQVVLLDDAFQHRSVKPGLNILLTEYQYPFTRDFLLPAGRLREWRSAYRRADIIVVSKCPAEMDETARQKMTREIAPLPRQRLYFSHYRYLPPYYLLDNRYTVALDKSLDVLLISAIARTDYLLEYLREQVNDVLVMEYEDHHYFSPYDMGRLEAAFQQMPAERKLILTTEKDAMRLELHRSFFLERRLPVFVLPVEVRFHFGEGERFDQDIKDFLLNFKV
jgi:tetraacyldisaccharide 4'-kinase